MAQDRSIAWKKDYIVSWMRKKVRLSGAKGGILGVSGGIDSSLVTVLAKEAFGDNVLGLIMPCHSEQADISDAVRLLNLFSVKYEVIDLSRTYDALLEASSSVGEGNFLSKANIKPRLRMATLYYCGSSMDYLVLGASNKDEIYVGYYTKYGDGGVDIMPIADLTKGEVKEMSYLLGIPEDLVERTPSGGLWPGQKDEDELGVSYGHLDLYLKGGQVPEEIVRRIKALHKNTEHKRQLPPCPRF